MVGRTIVNAESSRQAGVTRVSYAGSAQNPRMEDVRLRR